MGAEWTSTEDAWRRGIWTRRKINRSVVSIGTRSRGMLTALNVDGSGRVRVHTWSLLDPSPFRMVPRWTFRLMLRWRPMCRHRHPGRIRVSTLLILNHTEKRQETVAPHRPIPQSPGVLGASPVPAPLNDSVRHRMEPGGRTRSFSAQTPIAASNDGGAHSHNGRVH